MLIEIDVYHFAITALIHATGGSYATITFKLTLQALWFYSETIQVLFM